MRYLGIDYGSKRVGLALSDEAGLMAFPHKVIENNADLLKNLEAIIAEHQVDEIVIGQSLNKEGGSNKIQASVEELITDLTLNVGLPVHLEPEQYTTQEAIRFQGRTDMTDAAAASIILNSFLTRDK
jgi:putative holliday junction resolvase